MKPRSHQPTLSPLCLAACLALGCARAPADTQVAPAQPSESVRQQQAAAPAAAAPRPDRAPAPSVPVLVVSKPGLAEATGAPTAAPNTAAPSGGAPKAKLNAPAEVHITTSGTRGQVQATLSMRATADIPRCVGRFVVPTGVTVVSGEREKDWGPVANGEQKQLQLTLLVPAQGSFVLAGGMDLYLSSGIRLHQGDAVQLGQ